MTMRIRQRLVAKNCTLESYILTHGLQPTPNISGGITLLKQMTRPLQKYSYNIASAITVLAANDYGSVKLCDLPAANVLIASSSFSISGTLTGSGFSGVAGSTVAAAVGTAAASAGTLSGTMLNVIPSTAGAGGTGVLTATTGATTTTEKNLFVAASGALYLNFTVLSSNDNARLNITGSFMFQFFDLS